MDGCNPFIFPNKYFFSFKWKLQSKAILVSFSQFLLNSILLCKQSANTFDYKIAVGVFSGVFWVRAVGGDFLCVLVLFVFFKAIHISIGRDF